MTPADAAILRWMLPPLPSYSRCPPEKLLFTSGQNITPTRPAWRVGAAWPDLPLRFILDYACTRGLCVGKCAKGIRLSEAGGIDSCEPTAVDARNQTQVLFNR